MAFSWRFPQREAELAKGWKQSLRRGDRELASRRGARDAEDRDGARARLTELEAELDRVSLTLQEEVSSVRELLEIERAKVESERVKYKELWRMSCEQLASHDELMPLKEREVEELKMCLSELEDP